MMAVDGDSVGEGRRDGNSCHTGGGADGFIWSEKEPEKNLDRWVTGQRNGWLASALPEYQ